MMPFRLSRRALLAAAPLLAVPLGGRIAAAAESDFSGFLAGIRRDAALQGIRPATIDIAFRSIQYLPHVIELDRKRNASLKLVSELSPREQADAVARMEENALIVQWVQQCLERRISSYRWALERLVVQAPDTIAADADRLIGELAAKTANPLALSTPMAGRAAVSKG